MICERYRAWITDAALRALQPGRDAEFSHHVRACAACRAELERMRKLVAAVDDGIAATVAGEPSPALATRVRQRVAEETAAPQWRITTWAPVAAGALALLALVSIWFVRREAPHEPNVASNVASNGTAAHARQSAPPAAPLRERQLASASSAAVSQLPKPHRPRTLEANSKIVVEPTVLVPAEEWNGVVSLYSAMQSGRVDGAVVVAGARNLDKPLTVDKLSIAPLEIPRLEEDAN